MHQRQCNVGYCLLNFQYIHAPPSYCQIVSSRRSTKIALPPILPPISGWCAMHDVSTTYTFIILTHILMSIVLHLMRYTFTLVLDIFPLSPSQFESHCKLRKKKNCEKQAIILDLQRLWVRSCVSLCVDNFLAQLLNNWVRQVQTCSMHGPAGPSVNILVPTGIKVARFALHCVYCTGCLTALGMHCKQ